MAQTASAPAVTLSVLLLDCTGKAALDRAIFGGLKAGGTRPTCEEDRHELLHEIYLKLPKCSMPLDDLRSYAWKVGRNYALDQRARAKREEEREKQKAKIADWLHGSAPSDPERELINAEAQAWKAMILRAAIRTISQRDREILIEEFGDSSRMSRRTAEETRLANQIAQARKRARERLTRAAHAARDSAR